MTEANARAGGLRQTPSGHVGRRPTDQNHYGIEDVLSRHFVESGKEAGRGPALMLRVIDEVIDEVKAAAKAAPERALAAMPAGLPPRSP